MGAASLETDPIAEAEDLIATGHAALAAEKLRARLAAGRGGLLAQLTLIRALAETGDHASALAEAREVSGLNPGVGVAALALGECLLRCGALPAAIAELQRALRLDPDLDHARLLAAQAWLAAGEADKALELSEGLEPSAETENLAARAKAMKAAARSDAGYVRHLFDQFSADYDVRMRGQLAYAAPEILHDLAGLVIPGRAALRILDLGCGTGLAGEVFKPMAARLDGVDLSPAMIEKARTRKIYDALFVGDIESLPPGSYDLVLAADTLVYLGDLAPVFAAVRASLAPEGTFLFTAEAKEGEGFELGPKRRWRHSEIYLRQSAERAGFQIAGLMAASPRTEAYQPVAGFAVALTAG